jgi:hypothetical protein
MHLYLLAALLFLSQGTKALREFIISCILNTELLVKSHGSIFAFGRPIFTRCDVIATCFWNTHFPSFFSLFFFR